MIEQIIFLARPAILKMKPYVSARSLATEARVFLDANESPYKPFEEDMLKLNRYPEPQPKSLRQILSLLYSVKADELLLGRGTSEAIDLFIRAFCESGKDCVMICPPTFGLYKIYAEIQGAGIVSVPLKRKEGSKLNFTLDVDGILSAWNPNVKIVFICSPNNPTGTQFENADILRILDELQGKAIVMLDEAYVEFSTRKGFTELVSKYSNLVVLRTLSKAWAMAGIRCGVAIAQAPLIQLVRKLQAPYPITSPAVEVVNRIIGTQNGAEFQSRMNAFIEAKKKFEATLKELSFVNEIAPSEANFVLAEFKDATQIMEACRSSGVLLRSMSHDPALENCIRISIGSPSEMQELSMILKNLESVKS
jgi:histidinol-phosphate aminotransferase